jgi:7-cyano-7-deazaguanine synthase
MKTADAAANARAGPTGKSVLLFSGGMDSVMYAYLYKPDIILTVPMGIPYEEGEAAVRHPVIAMLRAAGFEGEWHTTGEDEGRDHLMFNFSGIERSDAIVPNRNAHLILAASLYGEEILLASVEGDRSLDKDPTFYRLIQQLLNHMWGEQHWTRARVFKVHAPYKHLTKTQLLRRYLKQGGPIEAVLNGWSCYQPMRQRSEPVFPSDPEARWIQCGICKPCVRKAVALTNNDYGDDLKRYFAVHPKHAPWLKDIMPLARKGKYRGREDPDIVRALNTWSQS